MSRPFQPATRRYAVIEVEHEALGLVFGEPFAFARVNIDRALGGELLIERDGERHTLTLAQIAERLYLPEGMRAFALYDDLARGAVMVCVEAATLPEVERGYEATYLAPTYGVYLDADGVTQHVYLAKLSYYVSRTPRPRERDEVVLWERPAPNTQ